MLSPRRGRVLIASLAAVLTVASLASVPSAGAAGGDRTTFRGVSIQIEYRGRTPALRKLSAATVSESATDVLSEVPFLGRQKHDVNAPAQPSALFPVEGWEIPSAPNLPVSTTKTGLVRSWEGSNHFTSRFSGGGNQFSGEPPDQGLCVGNGFVMETVNSVIQIYDQRGHALIEGTSVFPEGGPVGVTLNEFYGYPPEFDRSRFKFPGPFLFDVSCYFDEATGRWFHLTDVLQQNAATGAFTGKGSIDLAVSRTSDPLGSWSIYSINTTNDGTSGTPNHRCAGGPCFADYPHIGADANGIYLTTNEYAFFEDGYTGAQLYALSKQDLVAGARAPRTVYFQNLSVPSLGQLAFTLRGAQGRPGSFDGRQGGTAWFLSSTAGDGFETGNTTGGSDKIVVWALTNTSSLRGTPALTLRQTTVTTLPYVFPPLALQKDGPTPLLDCINQGVDCVGDEAPFVQDGPYPLDAGDTRMMSTYLEHGILWGTLDTALKGAGGSDYREETNFAPEPVNQKAGILYVAIRPRFDGGLKASVVQQGYVGVSRANLTYPSIAMGGSDVGFIGATLVGPGRFPSAAYIRVGLGIQPSIVRIAAAGRGPDDGFTGTFEGDFRPRWGDYGYAVPGDGGTVWLASEYIAQRCTSEVFLADQTCGFTRSFFANWSTRVSQLRP